MEQKERNMSDAINQEKQEEKKKRRISKLGWSWKLVPLQFVLMFLPLLMHFHMANSGYTVYPWHSAEDTYVDLFLHGKMMVFMAVAAVTLGLAIWKVVKIDAQTRKQSLKYFIPIFIYAVLVIFSTICSENISYSLLGSLDAKEPMGVLLGYAIMVFYAYLVIDDLHDVARVVTAAVIGSTLMAVTGVLQTLGYDPFTYEQVQHLFVSQEYILEAAFPKGVAYGTLFNPNYVGTYVALNVPLLLIGFVMYDKLWKKLVCGFSFVGLLVMLFASQSRTGLIAVIAVAVMLLIFLFREIWKRWYVIIPGVTFLVMSFLLIDTYRDNLLTNRLKAMFAIDVDESDVTGVDTTGNGVRVLYKDTEFTVKMPVSKTDFAYIAMEGDEQREVTYNEDKSYGYFDLSNGDTIAIQTARYEDVLAFGLNLNGRDYFFTSQIVVGNYKYINMYGRLDESIIPTNVLPGYEGVASGRGYVWGRTIPLLLDNFIVGSGPDTFGIEFPQNDYVARYRSGFENTIFTRPHNFYLQMGIQTGTFSLIMFLLFMGMYLVSCYRRYFIKKFTSLEQWFGFAIFLGTVGFLASGFANDSLIVVTPIFYVLLGVGMAINHKLCPVVKEVKEESTSTEEAVAEAVAEEA